MLATASLCCPLLWLMSVLDTELASGWVSHPKVAHVHRSWSTVEAVDHDHGSAALFLGAGLLTALVAAAAVMATLPDRVVAWLRGCLGVALLGMALVVKDSLVPYVGALCSGRGHAYTHRRARVPCTTTPRRSIFRCVSLRGVRRRGLVVPGLPRVRPTTAC